ncbi:MAG: lysylphosphatidylglycerol synthase transmembrane domain-containing protein [Bacteroidales bacterium]|jgi:uncharacterized protein (TIRG00374 family)|nr:lysylphosphatidylglycerol synthase transmembrane domain-containing protein [Bacteroidales bacterium]
MNDHANIGKIKRPRRLSPFLLIRLLGVGLFIYILATVDLDALWMHMKEVQGHYLLLAIFFQVMLLFIKALRWHILNDGSMETMRWIRSFGEFFESYAIGVITPGRLGELVKAGHAKEKNRIMETGIRVVVERGFDLGIFVVIAGLALLFTFTDTTTNILGLLALLGGLVVMILAFIFMESARATHFVQVLLNRLPFLSLNLDLNFRKRAGNIQAVIFLLSVISNLSYFVSCYFLAAGLSFELSFLYISGAVAIAGLLNMLPITVMGLGTREGTFLLLFNPLAEPLILAFSGLVFLVAQIGGGIIAFILGYVLLLICNKK